MASFKEIRNAKTIDEVATGYLQLKMSEVNGELRCHCPRCGGEMTFSIRSAKKPPHNRYFTCHVSEDAWGDSISMVAHCHNISMHKAGEDLSKWCMDADFGAKAPESKFEPVAKVVEEKPATKKFNFDPVKIIKRIKQDHQLVEDLGFGEIADLVGIGYSAGGTMRDMVLVPVVRIFDGHCFGMLGIDKNGKIHLPKAWNMPDADAEEKVA